MAERPIRQGWRVPQRLPFLGAAALLLLIATLLVVAGWIYERSLASRRHLTFATFPAPGVEAYVHDGRGDPVRAPPPPDPAIAAAKRATVREGIAGWR